MAVMAVRAAESMQARQGCGKWGGGGKGVEGGREGGEGVREALVWEQVKVVRWGIDGISGDGGVEGEVGGGSMRVDVDVDVEGVVVGAVVICGELFACWEVAVVLMLMEIGSPFVEKW